MRRPLDMHGRRQAGGGALPPLLSLYLDGTGDYVSVADAAALTPAGAVWSVGGWVWLPALPTGASFARLLWKGDYPNDSLALGLGDGTHADTAVAWHPLALPDPGTSQTKSPRYGVPAAGRWCYIANAFDGAIARSGAAAGPEPREKLWFGPNRQWTIFTDPGQYATTVLDDGEALLFGAGKISGVIGASMARYMHDWCMWSRAITQSDVEAHIAGNPSSTDLVRRWFHQRTRVFDDGAAYPPVAVADAAYVAMPGALPRTIKKAHFIGDSLTSGQEPDLDGTDGFTGVLWRGGWRRLVVDAAALRGVTMHGVGLNYTNEGHPCEHGGWPGQCWDSVSSVAELVGSAALAPNAVLVNFGTNDIVGRGDAAATVETNFTAGMTALFATGGLPASTPVGIWPLGNLMSAGANTIRDDYHAWLIATGIPAQVALGRNVQWVPHTYVGGDNAAGDTNVHFSEQGYTSLATTLAAWLAANGC